MFRTSLIKWVAVAAIGLAAPVFAVTLKPSTAAKHPPTPTKTTNVSKDAKDAKSTARKTPAPAALRLGTTRKATTPVKHTTITKKSTPAKHTLTTKKSTPANHLTAKKTTPVKHTTKPTEAYTPLF